VSTVNRTRRLAAGVILAAGLGGGVAAAQVPADQAEGVYVTGSGAVHYRQPATDEAARSTFSPGYTLNAGAGYRWSTFRVEGEFTFFRNAFDTIELFVNGGSLPAEDAEGHARGTGFLGMVYYDVPVRPGGRFRPYLGVGGGTYRLRVEGLTSPTLGAFGITVHSTTPYTRVLQFRGGTSLALAPRTDLTVGYRWFRGFPVVLDVPGVGELRPGGGRTHGLEVGLRHRLGGR
jgi:opacity protein-like surface antigen